MMTFDEWYWRIYRRLSHRLGYDTARQRLVAMDSYVVDAFVHNCSSYEVVAWLLMQDDDSVTQ